MGTAQQTMVDALDPARAVVYGLLVEAAYKMYENDPNNLTPAPSLPTGYTFVAWVQMQDFFLWEADWKFYGILAVKTSTNRYVLAIRGTEGLTEWIDDLTSMILVPLPGFGMVGYGFYRIYQTLRVVYPPPTEDLGAESLEQKGSFAKQVAAAIRLHAAQAERSVNIDVTGHSLGAALATIYVADHSHDPSPGIAIPLICTFASPRVGDHGFASKFDALGITSWRIVDEPDLVPKLPVVGFYHIQTEYSFSSLSFVVWTFACFHYLETYLHWLDPKQPLKSCCVRPPSVARTAQLRSRAALSAPTQKEIALSAQHEAGTTINITIKIGDRAD
jgi:hypothetical protein